MKARYLSLLLLSATTMTTVTLAFGAGPAMAASAAHGNSTARHASITRTPVTPSRSRSAAVTATSGYSSTTEIANAAGDPCKTSTNYIDNQDALGITLFSLNMATYWCYNYEIVTSHSTRVGESVTGFGADAGWEYIGDTGVSFSCYKASGSTRSCSGNEEDVTGYFYNVLLGESCSDTLHQWENYKGDFYHHESTTC